MKINIKQFYHWVWGCIKRGLFLIIPVLIITMSILDVIVTAKYHYPANTSVQYLQIIGVVFYISCIWCILTPLNKWNKALFIISLCSITGMFTLNSDIQKISQHAQCVEISDIPCPKGISLGGG